MWESRTIQEIRDARRHLTGKVALVPTMGALHAGHLSLIDKARQYTPQVIVSIFVNPTQFAPHEDFGRYPRPIEHDLQLCRDAGVTGVFHPATETMYPPGRPACDVVVSSMAGELEGALRPGHFAGVCRVVAKLLGLVEPDVAVFGQKDLQQLLILQAMVADLNFPVQVVASPTLREPDGLAMSSRNVYLSESGRKHARGLFKALSQARQMVREDRLSDPKAVEEAMTRTIRAHHLSVDYAVVRHARTLAPVECIEPDAGDGVAAVVAGRVDGVRLIDNMML